MGATLAALRKIHAHACLLVPALARATLRIFVQALFGTFAVAGKVFRWWGWTKINGLASASLCIDTHRGNAI